MMTRRRGVIAAVLVAILFQSTACIPHHVYARPITDAALARLRQCESSGDYSAVSASGRYRGAYQFDRQTWRTVGGKGDPAAAAPWEQDHRARLLYDSRGRQPWPVCGRRI